MQRYFHFLLKIIISSALIYFIFKNFDFFEVLQQLKNADLKFVALSVLFLCIQIPLSSFRWLQIVRSVGYNPSFLNLNKFHIIGQFFNQTMPVLIVGDGVRIWLLKKEKIPTFHAAFSVVIDRLIGMATLLLTVTFGLYYIDQYDFSPTPKIILQSIAIIGFLVIVVLFWLGSKNSEKFFKFFPFGSLKSSFCIFHNNVWSGKSGIIMLALSFLVHLQTIISLYFFGLSIGLKVEFVEFLLVIPAVMFLASVPVSLAGWGVREGAMVGGLALIGVGGVEATTISVMFGLSLLFIFLPGGVLWLKS